MIRMRGCGHQDQGAVDDALRCWQQGDVALGPGLSFIHLADLSRPHSPASAEVARTTARGQTDDPSTEPTAILDEVPGVVVLSQTCDVVRASDDRPFVEVAPLVQFEAKMVHEVRQLRRPQFAYVPGTAEACLVADLDRVMTVEKAIVASWTRTPGCNTDDERRAFAMALSRKRARFAFPDDFVAAARKLQDRLVGKHDKQTDEGAHLQALREIRVRAAPSWDHDPAHLTWWFIKDREPVDVKPAWNAFADQWTSLFDGTGRFCLDPPVVCRLDDITAREYTESDVLDLDRLSA